MKVYGPYTRKSDSRKIVVIVDGSNRTTQTYAKYLLEAKLGRKLQLHEDADHIDNNPANDSVDNLQALDHLANMLKGRKAADRGEFYCPVCKSKFVRLLRDIRRNQGRGKKGPYCSKRCSGKVNH